MHPRARPLTFLLLVWMLAGCVTAAPVEPTLTPRPPTRTPTARPTLTATPTIAPTFTPTATRQPEFLAATEPVEKLDPFIIESSLDWATPGIVSHLFASDPTTLWMVTEDGIARYDRISHSVLQTKFEAEAVILGLESVQGLSRVWLVRAGGLTVSAWDGDAYANYGFEEGWLLRAEPQQPPLKSSFERAETGLLWISTAEDVRAFDGLRWRVFTATEIGLPLPYRFGVHSSFVVATLGEDAWAGSCHWRGRESIAGSGGLRRWDGSRWQVTSFPGEDGCVTALAADAQGRMLVAHEGVLWLYSPGTDGWEQIGPRQPGRAVITEIVPGPDGLWARYMLCDEIDCQAGEQRVEIRGNQVVPVISEHRLEDHILVFDALGTPWFFTDEGAFRLTADGSLEHVAGIRADAAASDPEGNLYILTQYRIDPKLWWLPSPLTPSPAE